MTTRTKPRHMSREQWLKVYARGGELNTREAKAFYVTEVRRTCGLTQGELGAKLGVAARTVRRWEAAQMAPHPVYLKRMKELIHGAEMDRAAGGEASTTSPGSPAEAVAERLMAGPPGAGERVSEEPR